MVGQLRLDRPVLRARQLPTVAVLRSLAAQPEPHPDVIGQADLVALRARRELLALGSVDAESDRRGRHRPGPGNPALLAVGAGSPAGCRAGPAGAPPAVCGSIVWASGLPLTCTRRGLAVSATGIISVSTPCSQPACSFSESSVSPRKIWRV